jgi:ADP-heptose:LPS heptosyltransferase
LRDGLSARRGVPLRILVTRLRYLGDVILTTPVIEALRECFPDAEIWYMAEPPHSAILENHPGLTGLLEAGRGTAATLSTIMKIRRLRFAAAIDLFYNPRSANILYLSGIPVRIGGGRKWRRRLYTDIFDPGGSVRTAIGHHLAAARLLGCEARERRPRIFLTDAELESGRKMVEAAFGGRMPGRVVAVQAGGTWPSKRWPVSSFAALVPEIDDKFGARTLLVTGPGEEWISDGVASKSGGRAVVMPVMSIREASAAIAACRTLVANDGGMMHAGVAMGIPTVGIFGPTEREMWFPYSGMGPYEVITGDAECAPCHLHECDDMKCLEGITVDEVIAGLGRVTGW